MAALIDYGQLYWTTAPIDYDWSYVEEMQKVEVDGKEWRQIKVLDSFRFEKYQIHRYGSGMHPCHLHGSEEAEFAKLPND